jgi:pimeloyl-ACP methyl ester carboxylesterase
LESAPSSTAVGAAGPAAQYRAGRGKQADAAAGGPGRDEDGARPRPCGELRRSRLRHAAAADPRHGGDRRELAVGDRAARPAQHRDRLVLVSSGGLGLDVSPILRAPTPRSPIPSVARRSWRRCAPSSAPRASASPHLDRLYLAEALPLLIVWGDRDPIIPVAHAEEAHRALPGSHLEILKGVGHVPQLESPGAFIAALERFLAETEPAEFDRDEWRARFKTA